jgi:NTE family protein
MSSLERRPESGVVVALPPGPDGEHRAVTVASQVAGRADLVLEGGGVKGLGLVGATLALSEAGYEFRRYAGASAGAICATLLAALAAAGRPVSDLVPILDTIDYQAFVAAGLTGRAVSGARLLTRQGLYNGDYLRDWLGRQLAGIGVSTFGDLAIDDDELPAHQRSRLVVTVSDVTRGWSTRLPWDYPKYGVDPAKQLLVDAVRASMSIPFYFRPVSLTSADGITSTLVDGGVLSNFPIDSFDRFDGKPPRWPTFGVTVMPNLPEGNDRLIPGVGVLRLLGPPSVLLEQLITTMFVGHDQTYLNQPWVSARAIRVDSTSVNFLDFDISRKDAQALYAKGYAAAQDFLSTWNWVEYLERFRQYR